MNPFEKVFVYSKKLAEAIFKGESMPDFDESDVPLQKKEMHEVFDNFRNSENTLGDLDKIDVNGDWENLKKIINPGRPGLAYIKYAAVLVILFGVASLFLFNVYDNRSSTSTVADITPGTQKATLTLANGQQVALTKNKEYADKNAHAKESQLVYNDDITTKESVYNILTIPRGGQFFVQLADGTKVWLNSESQLRYPVHFSTGQARKVELVYGEAFFDVSHSSEHGGDSFVLQSETQEIEVLGTQFNVKAYKGEGAVYTTLVKGSIALGNGHDKKLLKPGEQAINTEKDQQIEIREVDVAYATAWKDGFFMFHNDTLEKMMRQLARWYDVQIIFDTPQIKQYSFSGTLKREDHISKLLNTLEKTGEITFEIKGKQIIVK